MRGGEASLRYQRPIYGINSIRTVSYTHLCPAVTVRPLSFAVKQLSATPYEELFVT